LSVYGNYSPRACADLQEMNIVDKIIIVHIYPLKYPFSEKT